MVKFTDVGVPPQTWSPATTPDLAVVQPRIGMLHGKKSVRCDEQSSLRLALAWGPEITGDRAGPCQSSLPTENATE